MYKIKVYLKGRKKPLTFFSDGIDEDGEYTWDRPMREDPGSLRLHVIDRDEVQAITSVYLEDPVPTPESDPEQMILPFDGATVDLVNTVHRMWETYKAAGERPRSHLIEKKEGHVRPEEGPEHPDGAGVSG